MALPGRGGLSNDDRNAKASPLNLSHLTERCLKTKLQTTPNLAMAYAFLLYTPPTLHHTLKHTDAKALVTCRASLALASVRLVNRPPMNLC